MLYQWEIVWFRDGIQVLHLCILLVNTVAWFIKDANSFVTSYSLHRNIFYCCFFIYEQYLDCIILYFASIFYSCRPHLVGYGLVVVVVVSIFYSSVTGKLNGFKCWTRLDEKGFIECIRLSVYLSKLELLF
jgi:hypothetical protein